MTTIKSFIQDISPDQDEREQIAISGKTIRETIEWKLDIIRSSKLTGSYIRHTKISPIDDLDIIFRIKAGNMFPRYKILFYSKFYLERYNIYHYYTLHNLLKGDYHRNHP